MRGVSSVALFAVLTRAVALPSKHYRVAFPVAIDAHQITDSSLQTCRLSRPSAEDNNKNNLALRSTAEHHHRRWRPQLQCLITRVCAGRPAREDVVPPSDTDYPGDGALVTSELC